MKFPEEILVIIYGEEPDEFLSVVDIENIDTHGTTAAVYRLQQTGEVSIIREFHGKITKGGKAK